MTLAWGLSCILRKVSFKCKQNDYAANWAFCCRGSRLRILSKSQDSSFCIFAVLILAQGFSWKVAMTGVLDDHCSDTFSAFSHRDSLEKSRWQGSSTIVARMHFLHSRTRILLKSRDRSSLQSLLYFHRCLSKLSLSPEDSHTFYKTSHVRIVMIALIFSKLILLPRDFTHIS